MTEQLPAHFNYNVKIGHGSHILKSGPLSQSLANCGEVIITSKAYSSYSECEKSMSSLMSALSFIESKFSTKSKVILQKLNPILDNSGKKHTDADAWDKFTVMRAYVADAEELKKSTLEYHVLGQIRVDQIILGLTPAAPTAAAIEPPPAPVISLK